MKWASFICILCLSCNLSFGQSDTTEADPAWKQHLQKLYLEVDAGALFVLSFGANANLGYQFHPLFGLGVTASYYSEFDAYFPAHWSGWGLHYRGSQGPLIWRLDYCEVNDASRSDDSLFCEGWHRDSAERNRYVALSPGYRFSIFKLSLNASRANLHLFQPCDGAVSDNRSATNPLALVPMLGISIGGKRKN